MEKLVIIKEDFKAKRRSRRKEKYKKGGDRIYRHFYLPGNGYKNLVKRMLSKYARINHQDDTENIISIHGAIKKQARKKFRGIWFIGSNSSHRVAMDNS